jgi:hypothetical protein
MKLPVWLPAIAYKAQLLYLNTAAEKDPIKAREVILRLIGDERMERVWARLYQQGHSESSVKQYSRLEHDQIGALRRPVPVMAAMKPLRTVRGS